MYGRFWSLLNTNPNDVSVTTLAAMLSRRPVNQTRRYFNTLKMTGSVKLSQNTDPNVAVATENGQRALLVLQNTSFATVAGDVAPTMYFGFGITVAVGDGIALPPGVGMVLDVRVPIDAIYCTVGPFVNTGSSVFIDGIVEEGGITDPDHDTANISPTGDLRDLTAQLARLIQILTPKG
jgi:hypothetical protein